MSLQLLNIFLFYLLPLSVSVTVPSHHRRILHHPLILSTPQPPSEPPFPSPFNHPDHHSVSNLPFSSTSSSSASAPPPDNVGLPFFPTNSPPPPSPPSPPLFPPPQPPVTDIPTFPANVSSLAIPTTSATHTHRYKLVVLAASAAIIFLSFVVITLVIRRKNNKNSSELRPLYPNDTPPSDGGPPPKPPSNHNNNNNNNNRVSQTSSEFLYLGTVSETSEFQVRPTVPIEGTTSTLPEVEERVYHLKLCGNASPELKPLPPLPKHSGSFHFRSSEQEGGVSGGEKYVHHHHEPEVFFSPSNSSTQAGRAGLGVEEYEEEEDDFFNNSGLKSCFSSSCRGSPGKNSPGSDSDVSIEIQALAEKAEFIPAPPPPPPSQRTHVVGNGPPPLIPPSGEVVMKRSGNLRKSGERNEDTGSGGGMKPKLKALYWDKVRASSDRLTVWDQLHPGSFKVNEEMIETLFTANGGGKDGARRSLTPSLNEEYRVLDPKKSQNIAILLKALSVTEKEVCEALLEGNADALGPELLESLLKMAPTKDEERKLLEYNDETPMKLGPAEKFLRAVLHVPFAFKRVDAMLYVTTFDCEIEYLRKAFEILEAACEQLRNSRMFLKLLEAVLKTGNRMNVGTNRGDALAFKLDTLLKLIDIKGRDGKTTLLHFVVQEIIKAEGARDSQTDPNPDPDPESKPVSHIQPEEIESRKRGLDIVSSLGGELMNVKKAAAMDFDSLSKDVAKLARDISKIEEILNQNEKSQVNETDKRFTDSMNAFLEKAGIEIVRIQSEESNAFAKVKELTEYFHGNLSKEETHPFRVFTVVRDFLGVLDQVCKEVGKINERTIMSAARHNCSFPELGIGDEDSSIEV